MRNGLSLARNSANSVTTNSTRKIQNATYPRRLALKFCQRRRLTGDMPIECRAGGTSRPITPTAVASGVRSEVRASTSNLPRLEVDAWVDPGVGEIGQKIHRKPDQRENIERGKHHRVVAVEHAFEAEQAEAVEREDGLDQQRTGEECVHEGARKAPDHDQHRVAKDVAIEHLPGGAALGARRKHVLLADLIEE